MYMDILYILGSGSKAKNLELLCSINLLKQNCLDFRKIYVVGDDPGFDDDFIFIEFAGDKTSEWKNVYSKIKFAIENLDLSDKFILMNDDFFCNHYFKCDDLPYFALKDGAGGVNGVHFFGIHAPYIIEKKLFLTLPIQEKMPAGFSLRSFYANFFKCPPTFTKDFILRYGGEALSFDQQIKDWPWFSIDDNIMLENDFVDWLVKKAGINNFKNNVIIT